MSDGRLLSAKDVLKAIREQESDIWDGAAATAEKKFIHDVSEIATNLEGDYRERADNEDLKNQKQDRRLRKEFARQIFTLVKFWLGGVFILLLAHGCGHSQQTFVIPPTVMITLIGGTTASVIGIFVLVTVYLFSEKRLDSRDKKSPKKK